MHTTVVTYGLGGYNPALPNSNVVSSVQRTVAGLSSDKASIQANGTDAATIHWAGTDATITWDVNGATASEATTPVAGDATGLREAALTVTATQAGPLDIRVGDDLLTIQAV